MRAVADVADGNGDKNEEMNDLREKVYHEAREIVDAFFRKNLGGFDEKRLIVSRRWNEHFSYAVSQEEAPKLVTELCYMLPDEVIDFASDGAYINMRFSFGYLISRLTKEAESLPAFIIPASANENALFQPAFLTASRLYRYACSAVQPIFASEKAAADFLWRVYAAEAFEGGNSDAYWSFFCRHAEQVLWEGVQKKAPSAIQSWRAVAGLGARKLYGFWQTKDKRKQMD